MDVRAVVLNAVFHVLSTGCRLARDLERHCRIAAPRPPPAAGIGAASTAPAVAEEARTRARRRFMLECGMWIPPWPDGAARMRSPAAAAAAAVASLASSLPPAGPPMRPDGLTPR